MGADCGTSLIGGVPLAFANVVPRGGVGVVAASGTGLQAVTTLIGRAGGGISHGIGVGGRDLRDEIGGITTLMAIDALDADRATQHIVLVSKPPAPRVAAAVLARIAQSGKPFTVCLLGEAGLSLPPNAGHARTLREAAERALGSGPLAPRFVADARLPRQGAGRYVRGLYCGGTLCAEAQLVLRAAGEAVASNAPVPGAQALAEAGRMHSIVDLGADEYTRGRPHPMIEPSIRNEPLHAALADPATAVVLVDVVIGYGAHPDPAGVLARALHAGGASHPGDGEAAERQGGVRPAGSHQAGARAPQRPLVIASVTGTEGDPQVYSHQVRTLQGAGVIVAPSNAHAAELALAALRATG
jgi:hypothetical protein